MGQEINLLDQYPRSQRPIEERARLVTDEHRRIAREFGREYFDDDRLTGYGGYSYHPRFWQATVRRFRDHYRLAPNSRNCPAAGGGTGNSWALPSCRPQAERELLAAPNTISLRTLDEGIERLLKLYRTIPPGPYRNA